MHELVDVLVNQMGSQFNELKAQKDLIQKVVKEEEESFLRTLEDGLKRIEQITKSAKGEIAGKQIFELYDTYGFPADLTSLILSEQNLSFNQTDFDVAMQEQKDRSKKSGKIEKGDWEVLLEDDKEEFVGYTYLETEVKITRYRKVKTKDGEQFQLVFNLTPFYPEGGGQVGDTGVIESQTETISIVDTKKENKLIVHFTDELPKNVNASFVAKVNAADRKASERNHTATHLLQESLRTVLGEHVVQKGSLVNPNYLRFDFTHFSKIEKADLQKIEADVNAKILANINLNEHIDLPLAKADDMGAIMLFGEKYDDVVRMIQFDSSKELCGGTHVNATGEIGLFKILSEGSTSSGIRRIEATAGICALVHLNKKEELLNEIAGVVKNKDLKKGVEQLITTNKTLEKQISTFKKSNAGNVKEDLLKDAIEVNDIRFIAKQVLMEAEDMKNVSFALRKEKNLVMVLAAKVGEKALLTVMLTDDVVDKGYNAGAIIRDIAKEIEGRGGGQAFFATAGGVKPGGIVAALEKAKEILG
jgi:alanyl-tRNA synthetase